MKSMLSNDKCFARVGTSPAFASDGVLRETIDIDEARTAFNFDLQLCKSYTEDGREIGGIMHLRRSDDDAIVPTRGLGREFVPVQHHALFNYVVEELIPQLPDFTLETVGTLNGGSTSIIMGSMGSDFKIKGDRSPYANRLFIMNPNGRSSVTIGFTNVRLWCQSQLQAAISSAGRSGFRVAHTKGAELKLDHALDEIASQMAVARALNAREERLADIPVGDGELNQMLNRLFPLNKFEEGSRGWTRMINQRQAVIEQFTTGKTAQEFEDRSALMLFQSITYPIHNPEKIGKESDIAHIALSNTEGSRAARVQRIFRQVEEVVGVAA